ncbi:MAG TPA: HAD-IA family hydrolase [Bacilli bacterium]|nr:HAD-IA family hydrolase [Bacilli bacterium]
MKKLIIFDLDGTLLDTLDDLKNAVNHALIMQEYPKRSREQIRQAIGNGVAKLIERSVPVGTSRKEYLLTLDLFNANYSEKYDVETKPYKGMSEMLLKLKEKGFLLAVCTNKTQAVAAHLISHFYPNIFDYVQGDEVGVPKKPSPDMIQKILDHFGFAKEQAFYIGDTDIDRLTAINSKLDYILVNFGYRTKKELMDLCPDSKTVSSADELCSALISLLK